MAEDAMLVSLNTSQNGALGGGGSSVDMTFLLSMNYEEAKTISPQSTEVEPNFKVAAETVDILKTDKEGRPKKVRAKGKVYLESGSGSDVIRILCQEAYISYDEAVLRGKPILQRGSSTIEGLDDSTVFYTLGQRVRVIGLHRLTNPDTMLSQMPDLGPWSSGPNPLLPALNESAVPSDIRNEMLKAAEAEMILQQHKQDSLKESDAPPAPWVKDKDKDKTKANETPPPATKSKKSGGAKPAADQPPPAVDKPSKTRTSASADKVKNEEDLPGRRLSLFGRTKDKKA